MIASVIDSDTDSDVRPAAGLGLQEVEVVEGVVELHHLQQTHGQHTTRGRKVRHDARE